MERVGCWLVIALSAPTRAPSGDRDDGSVRSSGHQRLAFGESRRRSCGGGLGVISRQRDARADRRSCGLRVKGETEESPRALALRGAMGMDAADPRLVTPRTRRGQRENLQLAARRSGGGAGVASAKNGTVVH